METEKRLYTVEAFTEFLDGKQESHYELIFGEVVEKVPTEAHGKLAALIAHFLLAFILPRKIQAHVGVEVRHQAPDDRYNSRLPDVSLRFSATPALEVGAVPQMPDLAVEIQSPQDDPRQMRQKALYYLQHGAHLVWLVYPQSESIEVCTLDANTNLAIETLDRAGTLHGGTILEGFSLSVDAIFDA